MKIYGTRYSASRGGVVSRGQGAVSTYSCLDGHILNNLDGGVIFWDSTPAGIEFKFVKTDTTFNQIKNYFS